MIVVCFPLSAIFAKQFLLVVIIKFAPLAVHPTFSVSVISLCGSLSSSPSTSLKYQISMRQSVRFSKLPITLGACGVGGFRSESLSSSTTPSPRFVFLINLKKKSIKGSSGLLKAVSFENWWPPHDICTMLCTALVCQLVCPSRLSVSFAMRPARQSLVAAL